MLYSPRSTNAHAQFAFLPIFNSAYCLADDQRVGELCPIRGSQSLFVQ